MHINDQIELTGFLYTDKCNLVKFLNNTYIQQNTLRLPFPYTENHAEKWIDHCQNQAKRNPPRQFAIRHNKHGLIGALGFSLDNSLHPHRDEIGYWLAKDFSGKQIATRSVGIISEYGFKELGLERIEAFVFPENLSSCKVLEKNNYSYEGLLRNYRCKNSQFLDSKIYAKLSRDQ